MDLDSLRALVAVADAGSLLGGAERLGLARSTLRRRLDELEVLAGVPLLHRGAQGAALTAAGELLVSRGRGLLVESSALLSAVRSSGGEASGLLRLAVPVGMPPHVMTLLYGTLREAHPLLSVELRISEAPMEELSEGIDGALVLGQRPTEGPWITRVLGQAREGLFGAASLLDRLGAPQTEADLDRFDLLIWRSPTFDPRRLPTRDGALLNVHPNLISADIHTLRQLALEGQGLAYIPSGNFPDPGFPDDTLRPVLPDRLGRDCAIRVVVPEALARAPKVRAWQQSVLDLFSES
ncbi:MAG: LysR family transcriptional regulator [Deltaproteobacteria bacterium]|nr:LysR family transcriptional regulator [Deltaproteobacteria bacterium]